MSAAGQLPSELDFFKYSQVSSPKRKASEVADPASRKRARAERDRRKEEDSESYGDSKADEEGSSERKPEKQRIATKGQDVPPAANSFQDMAERYELSQYLVANLEKYGFRSPTGIQSQGCPILMEVRRGLFIAHTS
jgi:ATP-dependent RNA helicase DDX52/ROK1